MPTAFFRTEECYRFAKQRLERCPKVGLVARTAHALLLLGVAFALLSGCATGQRSAVPQPDAEMPADPRLEDLRVFEKELVTGHANLFFHMEEERFYLEVAEIAEQAPAMNDAEFELALRKVLAQIGDPHTTMSRQPEALFPFRFFEFAEGVATTAVTDRYVEALGMRLVSVDEVPIGEVKETLAGIIPHRNNSRLTAAYTSYLAAPAVLHLLGITDKPDRAVLQFQDEQGVVFPVPVEAVRGDSSVDFIHLAERLGLTRENAPLYQRGGGRTYWHEYVPEERLLFVQYNACVNDPDYPIAQFVRDVRETLLERDVARVVMDLRRNGGGDSSLLRPLIETFAAERRKPEPAYELYAFIGRRTFSSAVLNAAALEQEAGATLVGEPTGGAPNHYGEVRSFSLPNLGRSVSYSTEYFDAYTGPQADAAALQPDISAAPSLSALYRRVDPAMQAIQP